MNNEKVTKLTIKSDRTTAIASQVHGASVAALGFNVSLIAIHNPKLATEIIKMYQAARTIKPTDPHAPDEDYDLFSEELNRMSKD